MTFKEVFPAFVAGAKIKRKDWGGYWRYYYGEIVMYLKDGSEMKFLDTKDILFTVSHLTQDDWEVM